MPLTETRLRALKPKDKPYKVADDRGLYIEVSPAGGKLWRFRYRIGPVEKKLSIGAYPEISLKQARQTAYEARHKIASGGDPAMEKRKQKIRAEFTFCLHLPTIGSEASRGLTSKPRTIARSRLRCSARFRPIGRAQK